jgi:16S rRNA (guanine527-N7)-methyltransferase
MTTPDDATDLAAEIFGPAFELARRYVALLATEGVVRGLIGPRETDRLWDRHVVNSAVVADLVPTGSELADVGSGAGLPGIPIALARPDVRVVLVEPMQRRCDFLSEVVLELDLSERVRVLRGRAPDVGQGRVGLRFDVVMARAVAPLDKLGAMLAPVTARGGLLLALRGARVNDELVAARPALDSQGWRDIEVVLCGGERVSEPTRVLRAVRSIDDDRLGGTTANASGNGGAGGKKNRQGGRTARDARRGREASRDQRARGQTRST